MKKLLIIIVTLQLVSLSIQGQELFKPSPQEELIIQPEVFATSYTSAFSADETWWHKWGHSTFSILYQATYHAFNAVGDGYLHRGHYITHDSKDITIGKTFNDVALAMAFCDYPIYVLTNNEVTFSWSGLLNHGIRSVGIRFIEFDAIHNTMIGKSYNYIGDISLTDKFWRKANAPPDAWWITRGITFVLVFDLAYNRSYK